MTYNTQIVADNVLLSYFVRYDRLTELINKEFYKSNYNEINLYIDMYSMVKSIYKFDPSQFIDRYSLASGVINACAHYREFFWTRYKVTCKIWIVFSRMEESIKEARTFYPGYSNVFTSENNMAMDQIIYDNVQILDLLCKYIPDVQFIRSEFEPGLVFGRIATSQYGINVPNIIVSKDLWNLQVVGNRYLTYMLRPVKKNGEDLSILINKSNVIEYYEDIRKMKRDVLTADPSIMNGSFISFIMAATRFPERGMKSLHNLSSVIKYLTTAINKLYINGDSKIYDIKGLCKDLNSVNKSNLNDYEIELRMNAIGFDACMFRYMTSAKTDNIDIINLHDPDSVKRINDKYFSKIPLNLMAL